MRFGAGALPAQVCRGLFGQGCGLALRTDKLAIAYQAALHIASILIWVRC